MEAIDPHRSPSSMPFIQGDFVILIIEMVLKLLCRQTELLNLMAHVKINIKSVFIVSTSYMPLPVTPDVQFYNKNIYKHGGFHF